LSQIFVAIAIRVGRLKILSDPPMMPWQQADVILDTKSAITQFV